MEGAILEKFFKRHFYMVYMEKDVPFKMLHGNDWNDCRSDLHASSKALSRLESGPGHVTAEILILIAFFFFKQTFLLKQAQQHSEPHRPLCMSIKSMHSDIGETLQWDTHGALWWLLVVRSEIKLWIKFKGLSTQTCIFETVYFSAVWPFVHR